MPARPQRIAFVGQRTYFHACALHEESERTVTTFIDHRAGRDSALVRSRLDAFGPDAVVLFRPETLAPGTLAGLPAPVLGFLTEPISRETGGGGRHWDLEARRRDLRETDPRNVDRIVSFDPMIAEVAEAETGLPVWRSQPLPVADHLFGQVTDPPAGSHPRMIFVGRSTVHREQFLLEVKHRFDVLHLAFGIQEDELARLLPRFHVTFNVHNEPYPSFENRVLIHLAAGHLVITEPLSPSHGLVAGQDYIEVTTPDELTTAAAAADRDLAAMRSIRESGRGKAENVRASVVWPELIGAMRSDIAEHGSHRSGAEVIAGSAPAG